MNRPQPGRSGVSLAEVLDRVIDRGAVVTGDAVIGLADVDLIRVGLRLVVLPARRAPGAGPDLFVAVAQSPPAVRPSLARVPPPEERPGPERGLAHLVLTVVELLRELLDRQAVRRAMCGTLTDEQAERVGVALLELDERMDELASAFGLDRRDLSLRLG
jgi:Gas vesicle protein K/Gas vesicle protein